MAISARERYIGAFVGVLGVTREALPGLRYRSIPEWDSARHMELVAAVEAEFGVVLEPDDILDFSGFEKGMEILSANYGIRF